MFFVILLELVASESESSASNEDSDSYSDDEPLVGKRKSVSKQTSNSSVRTVPEPQEKSKRTSRGSVRTLPEPQETSSDELSPESDDEQESSEEEVVVQKPKTGKTHVKQIEKTRSTTKKDDSDKVYRKNENISIKDSKNKSITLKKMLNKKATTTNTVVKQKEAATKSKVKIADKSQKMSKKQLKTKTSQDHVSENIVRHAASHVKVKDQIAETLLMSESDNSETEELPFTADGHKDIQDSSRSSSSEESSTTSTSVSDEVNEKNYSRVDGEDVNEQTSSSEGEDDESTTSTGSSELDKCDPQKDVMQQSPDASDSEALITDRNINITSSSSSGDEQKPATTKRKKLENEDVKTCDTFLPQRMKSDETSTSSEEDTSSPSESSKEVPAEYKQLVDNSSGSEASGQTEDNIIVETSDPDTSLNFTAAVIEENTENISTRNISSSDEGLRDNGDILKGNVTDIFSTHSSFHDLSNTDAITEKESEIDSVIDATVINNQTPDTSHDSTLPATLSGDENTTINGGTDSCISRFPSDDNDVTVSDQPGVSESVGVPSDITIQSERVALSTVSEEDNNYKEENISQDISNGNDQVSSNDNKENNRITLTDDTIIIAKTLEETIREVSTYEHQENPSLFTGETADTVDVVGLPVLEDNNTQAEHEGLDEYRRPSPPPLDDDDWSVSSSDDDLTTKISVVDDDMTCITGKSENYVGLVPTALACHDKIVDLQHNYC